MNSTLTNEEEEIGKDEQDLYCTNLAPVIQPPEILSKSHHTAYNNFPVSMINQGRQSH